MFLSCVGRELECEVSLVGWYNGGSSISVSMGRKGAGVMGQVVRGKMNH